MPIPSAVAPSPTPRPLGNPIVVDRSPARGEELALDKPISLVFDQAMDRTSVEQAIRVRSNGTTVSGSTFTWTRDNAVTITPPAGWETATSVEVDVAALADVDHRVPTRPTAPNSWPTRRAKPLVRR